MEQIMCDDSSVCGSLPSHFYHCTKLPYRYGLELELLLELNWCARAGGCRFVPGPPVSACVPCSDSKIENVLT